MILNNLNKMFAHLIWSHWALLPSKYSPPLFIYCSEHFFQFWKHSWHACIGIQHSSASKFSLVSLTDRSCCPFSTDFSLVKRKKSPLVEGLVGTEAGGWPSSNILWENHKSEGRNAPECCHDGVTIFFSPSQFRPFSPHFLFQPFHHLQITFLVHCPVKR